MARSPVSPSGLVNAKPSAICGMRSRKTMPSPIQKTALSHAKNRIITNHSSLRVLFTIAKKSPQPVELGAAVRGAPTEADPIAEEGFAIHRLSLDAPRVSYGVIYTAI